MQPQLWQLARVCAWHRMLARPEFHAQLLSSYSRSSTVSHRNLITQFWLFSRGIESCDVILPPRWQRTRNDVTYGHSGWAHPFIMSQDCLTLLMSEVGVKSRAELLQNENDVLNDKFWIPARDALQHFNRWKPGTIVLHFGAHLLWSPVIYWCEEDSLVLSYDYTMEFGGYCWVMFCDRNGARWHWHVVAVNRYLDDFFHHQRIASCQDTLLHWMCWLLYYWIALLEICAAFTFEHWVIQLISWVPRRLCLF